MSPGTHDNTLYSMRDRVCNPTSSVTIGHDWLSSGSNNAGIFDGNTAKFCLAMLILNMLVKCTAIYSFLRYYKELEAGVIHPPYNRSATRRRRPTKSEQGRALAGGGSTYDMEPMSPGEEEAPIGSPQGKARPDTWHMAQEPFMNPSLLGFFLKRLLRYLLGVYPAIIYSDQLCLRLCFNLHLLPLPSALELSVICIKHCCHTMVYISR